MIGSERNSRNLADGPHGFVAVHLRHHDVHQHQIDIRRLLQQLDAGAAVFGVHHFQIVIFQQAGERENIAHVVVHHQHRFADQRQDRSRATVPESGTGPGVRSASARCSRRTGFVEQPLQRMRRFTTLVRARRAPAPALRRDSERRVAHQDNGGTYGPSLALDLFHQLQRARCRQIRDESRCHPDTAASATARASPAVATSMSSRSGAPTVAIMLCALRFIRANHQQLLHALLRGLLDGGEGFRPANRW